MKPRIVSTTATEIRCITAPLELRSAVEAEESSRLIRGYAAKFETMSEPLSSQGSKYIFRETIARGAFDEADFSDVRALFNHDPNIILARSKGGTGSLRLGVDEVGLWYEFEAPNTTAGNDLLESVRRGDIDQSSFGFRIAESGERWTRVERGTDEDYQGTTHTRTILRIAKIYDVSPVTEPAYADTSVAVRSLERFTEEAPPFPNHSIAHRLRALDLIDKTAKP